MQEFTDLYGSAALDDHLGKIPVLTGLRTSAARCCNEIYIVASAACDTITHDTALQMVTLF
jgi:hypothetical protein